MPGTSSIKQGQELRGNLVDYILLPRHSEDLTNDVIMSETEDTGHLGKVI